MEASAIHKENSVYKTGREIVKIEFNAAIYPRYAEVGKLYDIKNEVIHKIEQTEKMLLLYTDSCGIKYGSPININILDVDKITYRTGYEEPIFLSI